MFSKAIVRAPGKNLADCIARADLGKPGYQRALEQHEAYCQTLETCGLELIRLVRDERYPDSTFVEDTAVVTPRGAVIMRPGAASRLGEIDSIAPVLHEYYSEVHSVREPGTVDGGDVCEAGEHFFIGVSHRTNEHGADQLARLLHSFGYSSSLIDIRGISSILHLKSGIAYLGAKRLVVIEALRSHNEFLDYELICLNSAEEYAANSVLINGRVLVASSFPVYKEKLDQLGYETIALDMSEFQKMDGGLSCLSLRF